MVDALLNTIGNAIILTGVMTYLLSVIRLKYLAAQLKFSNAWIILTTLLCITSFGVAIASSVASISMGVEWPRCLQFFWIRYSICFFLIDIHDNEDE
jgi:hypothetical protein